MESNIGHETRNPYVERDKYNILYETFSLEGLRFRGRMPIGKYFVCLGGAQTFGCYTASPFPVLLSKKINLENLNLGYSGAGPRFFLEKKDLWKHISNGEFTIIQMMSGRSEGNSLFKCMGENLGFYKDNEMTPLQFWNILSKESPDLIRKLINETRCNYINNMSELLSRIEKPKILLWFSRREPRYEINKLSTESIWSDFPQLINHEVMDQLMSKCTHFCKCVTSIGLPQKLKHPVKNDFLDTYYKDHPRSGTWRYQNNYYPSPEMHIEASKALFKSYQQMKSVIKI